MVQNSEIFLFIMLLSENAYIISFATITFFHVILQHATLVRRERQYSNLSDLP